MYSPDDCLAISGLQHFRFCRRQWALIHIERQWAENLRTAEGRIMHERAHDELFRESRGDTVITRSLRVQSMRLGLAGECDVVEFRRDDGGVTIAGHEGKFLPYPVEYKRGAPKEDGSDELQLCAQAMCLEEMLCCEIAEGALFYGETRRRKRVELTNELRNEVENAAREMHEMFRRGHTPSAKPTKGCNACSLKEVCLPRLKRVPSASEYIRKSLEDDE